MRPIRERHRSQPITSPDTLPLGAQENLRKERLSQVAFSRYFRHRRSARTRTATSGAEVTDEESLHALLRVNGRLVMPFEPVTEVDLRVPVPCVELVVGAGLKPSG